MVDIIIIYLFTPTPPATATHVVDTVIVPYAYGRRWRCGAANQISRERGNAAGPTGNLIRRLRRRRPVNSFGTSNCRVSGPNQLLSSNLVFFVQIRVFFLLRLRWPRCSRYFAFRLCWVMMKIIVVPVPCELKVTMCVL